MYFQTVNSVKITANDILRCFIPLYISSFSNILYISMSYMIQQFSDITIMHTMAVSQVIYIFIDNTKEIMFPINVYLFF